MSEIPFVQPDWRVRPPSNVALVQSLSGQVDSGEAEAIALALELGGLTVILDDRKARRLAQRMGLPIIGTIGILLKAKATGLISEVKEEMDSLASANFRIAPALYAEALRLAGES